jgi:hypothetical protein
MKYARPPWPALSSGRVWALDKVVYADSAVCTGELAHVLGEAQLVHSLRHGLPCKCRVHVGHLALVLQLVPLAQHRPCLLILAHDLLQQLLTHVQIGLLDGIHLWVGDTMQ